MKASGRLTKGCCCGDDCLPIASGQDSYWPTDLYTDGQICDMCVNATLNDWMYIWSWGSFLDMFTVAGATNIDMTPCFNPLFQLPPPITLPDISGFPTAQLPGSHKFKIVKEATKCPPTAPDMGFPLTSFSRGELTPTGDLRGDPCWNLCTDFIPSGPDIPSEASYIIGEWKDTNCVGAERKLSNVGITTLLWALGVLKLQYDAHVAGTVPPETALGHIIWTGDRQGWWSKPALVRICVYTEHKRWRLARKRSIGRGWVYRDPPPWPYYKTAHSFYSINQEIWWDVKCRTKQLPAPSDILPTA